MSVRMVVLLGVLSAFWIVGLLSQMQSAESVMRYLVLSLAVVAFGVWRMPRRAFQRRRFRDRRRPPQ